MTFFNSFACGFSNSFGYCANVMMDDYIMRAAPSNAMDYCYVNLESPSGLSSWNPVVNYAVNRPYMGGFTGYTIGGFPLIGFDNSSAISSLGSMGMCYLA